MNVEESFNCLINEIIYHNIKIPKTINEITQFISQSTSKQLGNIIFDTSKDDWDISNCSISGKLLQSSNILIVMNLTSYLFGCYFSSTINQIGKYCECNQCFTFSLNNNKTYSIKSKQKALLIHKYDDEKLITIGKEDIVIYKKSKKDKCYCLQSSFDYGKERNVLIGKEGKNNPFTVDRVVIFQMI